MDAYLTDRQAMGFNAVGVFLLQDVTNGGKTFDGVAPFTTGTGPANWDPATPNPAYWARVDHFMAKARDLGIAVFVGASDWHVNHHWIDNFRTRGDTAARNYGAFLGSRYSTAKYPNVVWLDSPNDYSTYPADDHLVTSVMAGIRSQTNQLHTSELLQTAVLDDANFSSVDLDNVYTYTPPSNASYHGWNRVDHRPVLFLEGHYEGEAPFGVTTTAHMVRETFWWATLAGALAGHMYGSKWETFGAGWKTGIDLPGARQLQLATALLRTHAWNQFVPDQAHKLVTGGYGTLNTTTPLNAAAPNTTLDANDYAPAALTSDGTLGVAYMPTARTIQVNAASMAATFTVRWFDPTTGTMVTGPSSPLPNTGTVSLTPPSAKHADGSSDWVLVLEA